MATQETNKSDLQLTYQKLINSFYELYPEKKDKINMSEDEMKVFLTSFAKINKEKPQYFNMLVKRDPKFFKGTSFTLLPKLKMEVVLSNSDSDANKKIIEEMWDTIWLLYLLSESQTESPDTIKMSKIASALEKNNNSTVQADVVPSPSNVNIEDVLKNLNIEGGMKDILGSLKDGEGGIKNILDNVMSNPELVGNMKNMMSSMGIDGEKCMNPNEKSNKFVSDILGDLKSKFKLKTEDGKIDSKQFVEQLMSVGSSIGDSYSKKLKSNELSINDILGAVTSMATNPQDDMLNELTSSLQLDKLDLNEVLNELKNKMGGKIPPELLNSLGGDLGGLGGLGGGLNNIDIGSLIGTMMSGSTKEQVKDLTSEQQKELEKYYEDLEL